MHDTALYAKTKRKKKRAPRDKRWTLAAQRALEYRLYGSLGPASVCRKIDPATGEVVATIPARAPEEVVPRKKWPATVHAVPGQV
jgi:hypothetical protein